MSKASPKAKTPAPDEQPKPKSKIGGARPGAGRKGFKPTDEQRNAVKLMIASGIQYLRICDWLDIDRNTFRKHFRREIDFASLEANTQVVARLHKATANSVEAIKVWLYNRDPANWKDRRHLETNLTIEQPRPDFSRFSGQDLAVLRQAAAIMRRASAPKQIEGTASVIENDNDDAELETATA